MRLQLKRRAQILRDLVVRTVTGSNLTDITDVSQWKGVLAAVAEELSAFYYELTRLTDVWNPGRAVDEDLDERALDFFPAAQFRLGPRAAIGTVILYRNSPTGGTVPVPAGAAVGKAANGVLVRTLEQAVLSDTAPIQITGHAVGQDSAPVAAVAVTPGAAGNLAGGALVGFSTRPLGVDGIVNPAAFAGGRDKESNSDFRERLKTYAEGLSRCPADAIAQKLLGLEYVDPVTLLTKVVRSVSVIDDPLSPGSLIAYIDDGLGTAASGASALALAELVIVAIGGEEFVSLAHGPVWLEQGIAVSSSLRGTLLEGVDYLLHPTAPRLFFTPPLAPAEVITADSYTYFTGLMAFAQKTVDGLMADRTNFPGYRAGGILARVLPPKVVVPKITGVIAVIPGADRATILARAISNVVAYVNQGGISSDVIRDAIIAQVINAGAYDLTLADPPTNVIVLDDELARVAASDVRLT